MDNSILISVIIPAYNAEKFLDRAVQSVLNQTAKNVELILVNDGSTDNSGAICDKYAHKNENVYVIHKTNGGSSVARNVGIDAANGEYLIFLDADDYLEPEACEQVENVICKYRPDCIDFGWRYITNGAAMPPAFHKLPKNELLDQNVIRELILPPLLNLRNDPDHFIFDFVWNKVFRTDIVRGYKIRFGETRRTWEDRPFVIRYLKYCNSYYAIDRCFYNYVDTPASLSRKYSLDFFRIILENFQLYKQLYGDTYDFDTEYVNTYWYRSIENMIYRSLEQTENQGQIRGNIIETLQKPQVLYWYQVRKPSDRFEKEIREMILSCRWESAVAEYEKKLKGMRCRERYSTFLAAVKNRVCRLRSGDKINGKTANQRNCSDL